MMSFNIDTLLELATKSTKLAQVRPWKLNFHYLGEAIETIVY